MTRRTRRHPNRRRGVALIVVIGMTAVILLIVGAMAMSGQVARVNSTANRGRDDARYAAESGAAYTMWMILASRQTAPASRTIGEMPVGDQHPEVQAWVADGLEHDATSADGLVWQYQIRDAAGGLDVDDPSSLQRLRRALLGSAEQTIGDPDLEHLIDSLADYQDTDNLRRLQGMERDDYEDDDGKPTVLPRNGAPLVRQELYWLPVFPTLLARLGQTEDGEAESSILRPIAPKGQDLQPPLSLVSTPRGVLRAGSGFTDEEWTRIEMAVSAWQSERRSLRESLGELYPRVAGQYSIGESGVYTVRVTGVARERYQRTIDLTLDLRAPPGGSQSGVLVYWEYAVE